MLVNMFILIGHNLVPHHHHVAFVNHPSSSECPTTHPDHHDKDSGSRHCHAFNDIKFVKYNHSQLLRPVTLSLFVIIEDPGTIPDPFTGPATVARLPLKSPGYSAEHAGKHSLRGPPVYS
jgi:hypothetical protein